MERSHPIAFGARVASPAGVIMSNAEPEQHPTGSIGRNQWDALVDTIDRLGRQLGPARLLALINFVLVIGVVAGSVYVLYLFNQDSIKSRDSIIEAYKSASTVTQKLMTTASDTVNKTYQGLGEISDKQIHNLKATLELHAKLTDELQGIRQKSEKLAREVEETGIQLAKEKQQFEEIRKIHAPTVATLGALGSLVDEAPELLRAEATKPAVRQILQNSGQLLIEVSSPEAQY